MEKIDNVLRIEIFELGQKFNEISTKGRARIFYRGQNRNGTYITEEFAEKLINTVPYTPVKGIWSEEIGDFEDHGKSRVQGKIYGVVLAEPNFSWQDFVDKDGITRTYACVDVIVYTAIYPEASQIIGKALSMELLPKSIKGNWTMIDGKKFFAFEDASFAGLQVLGDDVEPCFEGAQFFSLFTQMQELYAKIKQFSLETGGNVEMPELNFKLSDGKKFELLWQALNPEYNEEHNWTVITGICDVFDDYALCVDYESSEHFRQYYTKSEEDIELGEKVKCYIVDLSEEEYNALKGMVDVNEGSYTKMAESYSNLKTSCDEMTATLSEKEAEIGEYNTKIQEMSEQATEYTNSISELEAKVSAAENKYSEMETNYTTLQEELEGAKAQVSALDEYKHNIEKAEKQEVIDRFAAKLDDEIVSTYSANIDNYTKESLEKELSYELVKATPSIFSLEGQGQILPKDNPPTGIEAILEKYK